MRLTGRMPKSQSEEVVYMAKNFKESLADSMADYQTYLLPFLERSLNGRLISVEGNTLDETAKLLDTLAGVDVWYANTSTGMVGIASRIQNGKNWGTFTVRAERASGARTEYEKRKYAMNNGFLYPKLTYQAYVDRYEINIGLAHTDDIFECIDKGLCTKRHTGASQIGQAEFYVVSWETMKKNGYRIAQYRIDTRKDIQ